MAEALFCSCWFAQRYRSLFPVYPIDSNVFLITTVFLNLLPSIYNTSYIIYRPCWVVDHIISYIHPGLMTYSYIFHIMGQVTVMKFPSDWGKTFRPATDFSRSCWRSPSASWSEASARTTQPQKITILGGNSGKHHAKNDKKLEVSEKQVYQFTIV